MRCLCAFELWFLRDASQSVTQWHQCSVASNILFYWTVITTSTAVLSFQGSYAPSQWETTLQCNVVSHWLGAYTKWSLSFMIFIEKSSHTVILTWRFNSLMPKLNFAEHKLQMIFFIEIVVLSCNFHWLKFVPNTCTCNKGLIDNKSGGGDGLVLHIGDKPLPETMMTKIIIWCHRTPMS